MRLILRYIRRHIGMFLTALFFLFRPHFPLDFFSIYLT